MDSVASLYLNTFILNLSPCLFYPCIYSLITRSIIFCFLPSPFFSFKISKFGVLSLFFLVYSFKKFKHVGLVPMTRNILLPQNRWKSWLRTQKSMFKIILFSLFLSWASIRSSLFRRKLWFKMVSLICGDCMNVLQFDIIARNQFA